MRVNKDLNWFKDKIVPKIKRSFELKFRYFDSGDFGALSQVEFNSDKIGGGIDFWGLGWLGILIYDYENDVEICNVLLEPDEQQEQEEAFKKLIYVLCYDA